MSKSKQKSPKFSEEFKLEAVKLSDEVGAKKAALDLGIGFSTLNKWRSKLKETGTISKTMEVKKSYSDLEKENRKLKKELGYMKEINDVLKKSTAIFSSNQIGDTKSWKD
jgi:transposase